MEELLEEMLGLLAEEDGGEARAEMWVASEGDAGVAEEPGDAG